jgi:hypothetical protein
MSENIRNVHEIPKDLKDIAKDFRDLDRTEKAVLDRIGGSLSRNQRKTLYDLERLIESLAGPEEFLDEDGYSRPFPPRQVATTNSIAATDSAIARAAFTESD